MNVIRYQCQRSWNSCRFNFCMLHAKFRQQIKRVCCMYMLDLDICIYGSWLVELVLFRMLYVCCHTVLNYVGLRLFIFIFGFFLSLFLSIIFFKTINNHLWNICKTSSIIMVLVCVFKNGDVATHPSSFAPNILVIDLKHQTSHLSVIKEVFFFSICSAFRLPLRRQYTYHIFQYPDV